MFNVYRIHRLKYLDSLYSGFREDLKQRFSDHNHGRNVSAAPYRPWKLIFYSAFEKKEIALDFECYLKSGSGKAFARKRLWKSDS